MHPSEPGGPGVRAHQDAPLVPAFLWPWTGVIIVTLTVVCGVFGVLTAGEIGAWPSEQRVADRLRTDAVPDLIWDFGLLLGDAWFFALVVLALGVWAVARRSWPALIACASVPGAVLIVELFLKPIVDRRYAWYLPSTYPSGTAAGVAAWTTLAWLLAVPLLSPRRRLVLALILGGLTSWTAVAIVAAEKHLPLDAVGGVALGIAVVLTCTAIIDLITHAHPKPGFGEPSGRPDDAIAPRNE